MTGIDLLVTMSKEKAETITNGRKPTNENISNEFSVVPEYSESRVSRRYCIKG